MLMKSLCASSVSELLDNFTNQTMYESLLTCQLAVFDTPGVRVSLGAAGPRPGTFATFESLLLAGISLRGPVANSEHLPDEITSIEDFEALFKSGIGMHSGPSIRQWFQHGGIGSAYFSRCVSEDAEAATCTLNKNATNATYTLTLSATTFKVKVTGGAFTADLTVASATAAQVQAAFEATPQIEPGDVLVTGAVGGPFTFVFKKTLGHMAHAADYLVAVGTGGATTATVLQTVVGSAGTVVWSFETVGPGEDYNGIEGPPAKGLWVTFDQTTGRMIIWDEGLPAEAYDDMEVANAARMEQFVNGRSKRTRFTWVDKTSLPDTTEWSVLFAGGDDGAAVTAAEILGDPAEFTGIYAFDQPYSKLPLGFICAPGYSQEIVGLGLISVGFPNWRVPIISSTYGLSLQGLKDERNQYTHPFGFGVYCAGWVRQADPLQNNALAWFPRDAARAALLSRSHAKQNSLANVGAGTDAVYQNVTEYEYDFVDDRSQGDLNRRGIDMMRDFTSEGRGRVQWSARTIAAPSNVLFRFIHVPVIASVLAVSIEQTLKDYIFGVEDGHTGKNRATDIKSTLLQMGYQFWSDRILFGDQFQKAFAVFIKGNPLQLENGILPIDVFFTPAAIIERIPVNMLRMPIGFDPVTGTLNVGSIDLAPNNAVIGF